MNHAFGYELPDWKRPQGESTMQIEYAWKQYDEAKCPDCGEDIPLSAVKGEACQNCEHVWAWGPTDDIN